jgi:hypothetical protein
MFKHNLKKWRPGWSEKILLTIQPTSENSILLKHGERRIELCCENKNHILMKRFVSKLQFFHDYDTNTRFHFFFIKVFLCEFLSKTKIVFMSKQIFFF